MFLRNELRVPSCLCLGISSRCLRMSMVVAVLFLSLFGLKAYSQTGQGSISGVVHDASDAVVVGATVEVVDTETGVTAHAVTNRTGFYAILALNPGTYTVSVKKAGFEVSVTKGVLVSTAGATTVSPHLLVGKVDQVTTVTADTDLLTKDTSEVTTTVDHEIVQNLPYPERSSLEAALLVPGVNGDPLQPGGIATENPNAYTSYVVPGASIGIGGAPPGTSSIVVDGSDVTQASYARTGVNLSNREVQEVTVIVGGISAKYGRTSGGIIVQSSHGGSNDYHGGLVWNHTDPYFNAYPIGTQAPSLQHQNFFGMYAGGPIRIPKLYNGKDKSFFFVGVEPARLRNTFAFRGIFQTPEKLKGRLHNSLPLLNQTILKSSGYAAALAAPRVGGVYYQSTYNAAGIPNGPYDPTKSQQITGPLSDCAATGVPDNPAATVCPDDVTLPLSNNPFAQFVLSQYPTPSNPGPYVKFDSPDGAPQGDGTNAVYRRGVINVDNRYSMRFDQQIGNKDHFFVRYTVIPVTGQRYFAVDPTNPLTIVPTDIARTHNIAFGETHVFTNTLVNNFHYSFMRVQQQRLAGPATRTQDYAAKYGLTPSASGAGFPSLGNFNANGIAYTMQMGIANAAIQIDQNFIAGDDLALTHGHHFFQFGGDLRWIQSNQYDYSGSTGGKYTFAAAQSAQGSIGGLPIATFALGTISTFTNTAYSVPGYYRWRYYGAYFQDDWRLTPRITLNLGLRYELEMPRTEKFNNQLYLNTNFNEGARSAALCFSGACGNPQTLWPANYKGFEPRVGIAVMTSRRTTLRAAYTLSRLPLTGYENVPDPNLQTGATVVSYVTGATNPSNLTNYISNPVSPNAISSAYLALRGNRGPIFSDGLTAVAVDNTNAVPYSQTWVMTFQYQVSTKTLLQASYQGFKGTHLVGPFSNYINTPSIPVLFNALRTRQNLGASTTNAYGIRVTGLTALNPYQNFADQGILQMYPRNGSASYHGLYLSVNQRLVRGLSVLANWTWSKELDNVPDTNTGANSGGFGSAGPQTPFDLSGERSVASFDQPSRLKYGFTYTLQAGRGRAVDLHNKLANMIIGDITVAGIGSMASGFPNAITLGGYGTFQSVTPVGTNGCTATTSNPNYCSGIGLPAGYTLRPNIVPGVPKINKNWKRNPFGSTGFTTYLNADAFSMPGSAGNPQFGNAPRLMADARSPRESFFDARFVKAITFKKRYQFNVNAVFSNLFNHPVYYGVNRQLYGSTTLNQSTGALTGTANTSFGQFNVSQSGGISRVIRVGAEFNF